MKEMTIDGVNVAGCKHYIPVYTEDTDTEINNCCTLTYTSCQFEKKNCYYKQLKRLEFELKVTRADYEASEQENAELKAELHKYENMAAKGLEEFKDVGGCWGCGLQLQLNQDIEDIKQLKAENERLKEEIETRDNLIDHFRDEALYRATIASEYQKDKTKLEQTLQEIKKIVTEPCIDGENCNTCKSNCTNKDILDLITKAEVGE